MGTKNYDSATDMITFSRASGGTALRRVGYGTELADPSATYSLPAQYNGISSAPAIGQTYRISITRTTSGGGFTLSLGGSSSGWITFTGTRIFYLTTTNTNTLTIRGDGNTSGNAINVSVKQIVYDRATDPLVLYNHPDNIPRIEYDTTGAVKGLLIEEARTNLMTYSNDFTNAVWIKSTVSNTANAGVSPDGTSNATKVVPATSIYRHYTYQTLNLPTADYSFSVYVASSGYGFATICAGSEGVSNYYAVVIDLSDGTQTALYSQGTHSKTVTVEPVGSYYRVTISGDGEKYYVVGASDTGTYTPASYGFKSFSGDGTSGILVYGAQAEAGSFPTSYIPTTSSSATRAADIASIPTSAFGYNDAAGTVVVEASLKSSSYPNSANIVSLADASNTDTTRLWVWSGADSTMRWTVLEGNVSQVDSTKPYTKDQLFSVAGAYKVNDFAISLDGSAVSTDTSGSVTSDVASLHIGTKTGGTEFMSGHIKSIQYYPRRLTNAQLQELTT